MRQNLHAEVGKLTDNIHDARIAQIGDVFLKRQAQNRDAGFFDLKVRGDEHLDGFLSDVFSHIVVDPPSRKDHFRTVADAFRFVGQVVGVDADAVPAYEAGAEVEEVPLGSRRLQHFQRIDAHFIEDDGQFVHQRDIDVALRVFDDLGRLRDFNRGNPVQTDLDDRTVDAFQQVQRGGVGSGDDFDRVAYGVNFVAGIDALRGIADREVPAEFQPGGPLQNRNAHIFRHARIHRRFIRHAGACGHVFADERRSVFQGA